ncbi:MAG: septum site-determining protein MinD [Eubacteriales bacterium]
MSNIIAVASGKGGVGKTMFAANIGAKLAQKGNKVVLIDMDLGLRSLDICLGLENRVVYDLSDILSGLCRIKQALIKDRRFGDFYLISAAYDKKKVDITPMHIKVLCDRLKEKFDYIIFDAPAGIGEGLELAATVADIAVIVTTPEYVAIRAADNLDAKLVEKGVKKRAYVVNKIKCNLIELGELPSITDISNLLKPQMIGAIQYDESIHISYNSGVPIVLDSSSYIESNFNNIANRLMQITG